LMHVKNDSWLDDPFCWIMYAGKLCNLLEIWNIW
jgi:hypothetical protein